MQSIKNKSPLEVCEEYTNTQLESLQAEKIWMSWWPVMERMLSRSSELEPVYTEICAALGHSLELDIPLHLTLEAIWHSGKAYSPETIAHKKLVHSELQELHQEIPVLALKLADRIRRQKELAEPEGFQLDKHYSLVSANNKVVN